tara:strand:- start:1469 stop:1624 length:156 start_codon:yes stop_codon:yes gene_type:complete
MKKTDSNLKTITTAIIFITGLLMIMTLFASCTTTGHTTVYGNQNSNCAAYL